ncbi:MAG: AlwI family type II restriction endonuclease, partial [Clostridia bacterium]|nr:AlwI family type II restriction endonuclease [Clostridia bacterium]
NRLLDLRTRRNAAERKRPFDRAEYERGAELLGCKPHTFNDYADMNIRYLKATGMVQARGKGIALIPEKHALAEALSHNLISSQSLLEIYRSLCNGPALPTDNAIVAYQVLEDLLRQIQDYGIAYSITGKPLDTPAQINHVRYEIESLIFEKKEEIYAREQAEQWQEIAAYMDLIASRQDRLVRGSLEINVPRAEAPAYLEWSLWRAFLAIDCLSNKPYEVRRFNIDQDFLPVSTAPGNGPDLIAEFEDCVVVIEVTLSESSRQEAMEGEPVRRHVADLMLHYEKPVYGLFIANKVDSNTAETFRIGIWYTRDDERLALHIVPFTLAQFSALFKTLFTAGNPNPRKIIQLMNDCECYRARFGAPEWKKIIADTVEAYCR